MQEIYLSVCSYQMIKGKLVLWFEKEFQSHHKVKHNCVITREGRQVHRS